MPTNIFVLNSNFLRSELTLTSEENTDLAFLLALLKIETITFLPYLIGLSGNWVTSGG